MLYPGGSSQYTATAWVYWHVDPPISFPTSDVRMELYGQAFQVVLDYPVLSAVTYFLLPPVKLWYGY
jgi:hypothetical protein